LIASDQFTCTTSAVLVTTLPGASAMTGRGAPSIVFTLVTASATVYIGGSATTTATNGLELKNGSAAPLATVTITGSGPIYALGAAGSEVLSYIVSWVDS
jgi:hypothetical protein